nr:hypothetical protein [Spirochaetaceae bacterium]
DMPEPDTLSWAAEGSGTEAMPAVIQTSIMIDLNVCVFMNSVSDTMPDKEIGVSPDFLSLEQNQGKPRSLIRLRGLKPDQFLDFGV